MSLSSELKADKNNGSSYSYLLSLCEDLYEGAGILPVLLREEGVGRTSVVTPSSPTNPGSTI